MIIHNAKAKLNLVLEILGKRDDGYHEVSTVIHTLELMDRLTFDHSDDLTLNCEDPRIANDGNIILRAAKMLQKASGSKSGASITLYKNIPVAGGLGGGSSDAAVTLVCLNRLWELEFSWVQLSDLASDLGSDVTFFLQEYKCALGLGRGEKITSLNPIEGCSVILLEPRVSFLAKKTETLYSMIEKEHFTDGSRTSNLISQLEKGNVNGEDFFNVFDSVLEVAFPGINEYRKLFSMAGAPFVALSGSGPTLYTFVDSIEFAEKVTAELLTNGHRAYTCSLR